MCSWAGGAYGRSSARPQRYSFMNGVTRSSPTQSEFEWLRLAGRQWMSPVGQLLTSQEPGHLVCSVPISGQYSIKIGAAETAEATYQF
jgi:hypothetical protein